MRHARVELGISVRFGDIRRMAYAAMRAEELKFSRVWVPDSQVIGWDAYIVLALFSEKTKEIKLGAGVTNPVTRDVTVTANLSVTLDTLSGGRFTLGLGVGDSGVKLAGLKPATIDKLSNYIDELRRLCNGDSISRGGVEVRLHRFRRGIPIYLAATGRRSLRLSGEKADGVIINVGLDRNALLNALQDVRIGAESANRNLEEIRKACLVFCCYSEDRNEARNTVRPLLAFFASTRPEILRSAGFDTDTIEKLERANRMFNNDIIHASNWGEAVAATSFAGDSLVDKICIAGNAEDFTRRIRWLESLGVDEVFFRPFFTQDPDLSYTLEFIENLGEYVVPEFM